MAKSRTLPLADHLKSRRVGIVLSSAFFGFYGHSGFVRAVLDAGIKPSIYGGSSAGALVAAFAASDHLMGIWPILETLKRSDIWDPGLPSGTPPGIIRGKKIAKVLKKHIPVERIEECSTPLVTISTNMNTGRTHRDTSGPIIPAVIASCSVPFMFRPVLRNGDYHVDGGLLDKAPIQAVIETCPVDAVIVHMIESQGIDKPLPRSPIKFLDRSLDLSRNQGWQTQADVATARGVDVYICQSPSSGVGPFSMGRGSNIMHETHLSTRNFLNQPCTPWPSYFHSDT